MKNTLKQELWTACIEKQQKLLDNSKSAMLQSQESANEEKGKMGDKFESFREQMQIDRDMHARQYDAALQGMNALKKIDPAKEQKLVSLGAVVITDFQKLFISASLGQIPVGDENYVAVSASTPIYTILAGKKKGDSFIFREKKYKVQEVL